MLNVLTKLNNTPYQKYLPTLIFGGHETGTTLIFHLGLICGQAVVTVWLDSMYWDPKFW